MPAVLEINNQKYLNKKHINRWAEKKCRTNWIYPNVISFIISRIMLDITYDMTLKIFSCIQIDFFSFKIHLTETCFYSLEIFARHQKIKIVCWIISVFLFSISILIPVLYILSCSLNSLSKLYLTFQIKALKWICDWNKD